MWNNFLGDAESDLDTLSDDMASPTYYRYTTNSFIFFRIQLKRRASKKEKDGLLASRTGVQESRNSRCSTS